MMNGNWEKRSAIGLPIISPEAKKLSVAENQLANDKVAPFKGGIKTILRLCKKIKSQNIFYPTLLSHRMSRICHKCHISQDLLSF